MVQTRPAFQEVKQNTLTLVNLLGDISKSIKNQVMRFLKNTGLFFRI